MRIGVLESYKSSEQELVVSSLSTTPTSLREWLLNLRRLEVVMLSGADEQDVFLEYLTNSHLLV